LEILVDKNTAAAMWKILLWYWILFFFVVYWFQEESHWKRL